METSDSPLRILVFGAGAIGTYIGGSLLLQGARVVFLERPEVAAEVKCNGLHLLLEDGEHHIPEPMIAASLVEAFEKGPLDVALFAMKSYDTQAALDQIASYLEEQGGNFPCILCIQNGVENEGAIAKVLGLDKVIAGTVTSAIGRNAVGNIVLERKRGMGIAAGHTLSERIVRTCNEAGLNAQIYPDPADMKWSKMLTNLLANATSAILDMTPAEVFSHRGLFKVELAQIQEALLVMHALNINVVDLPGTPVRRLAWAVSSLPKGISRPLIKRSVGRGRGGKMPSFHIDLHSGRNLSEVDYLNGAVARFGEEAGIPTPVNRFLKETLLAIAWKEIPLDYYSHQPEKLIKDIMISIS